jgi:rod shape-determining protein MreC
MYRYIAKNKGVLLLAGLVLAGLLWMTSQVRHPGPVSPLDRAVSFVSYPLVKAVRFARDSSSGIWNSYFNLVGTKRQSRLLVEANSKLTLENTRLMEALAKEKRLDDLLAVRQETGFPIIAANAVGRDASSWFKSLWIDKGEGAGITRNLPVMVYTGVVGKVIKTYGWTSRIQLITDPSSAVSTVTERTREPGILVGDAGGGCKLLYVGKHADVAPGDLIVTSGLDGIFPKGVPAGEVVKVSRNSPGYFLEVDVKPTADIARLEEVLVLRYTPPAIPREPDAQAPGKNGAG